MLERNIDPRELGKFESLASRWWDPDGDLRTLHDINPTRLHYINERAPLAGKKVLDVGCGGGILSEAMARLGAEVSAIDASEAAIEIATLHALKSQVVVAYAAATPEEFVRVHAGEYDVVTCLELLEHVPQPENVIQACARLVRPSGPVFFSTINRTARAYLMAVIGAEYLLGLLPRGTHQYARFIRPSEFARWARRHALTLADLKGFAYNPLTREVTITDNVAINYIACMLAP